MVRFLRRFIIRPQCNVYHGMVPVSRKFGFERGQPIDRYFIENFLRNHSSHICGSVSEFGDTTYTDQFGLDVTRSITISNDTIAQNTNDDVIYGDISDPNFSYGKDLLDCIICTNVLNFIFNVDASVATMAQMIKPEGGVVLATLSSSGPISRFDYDRWGDYWRFTDMSARHLFEKYFEDVSVTIFGNFGLCVAFYDGQSVEDLNPEIFNEVDPDYQLTIGIVAKNPRQIAL